MERRWIAVMAAALTSFLVTGCILVDVQGLAVSPGVTYVKSFQTVAGQRLSAYLSDITFATDYSDARLSLVDTQGSTVATGVNATSENFVTISTGFRGIEISGEHEVRVSGAETKSGSADLKVSVDQELPVSLNGPSISTVQATPGSSSWHTFSGNAGDRVSIYVHGVTCASDYNDVAVQLYDPRGRSIKASPNATGQDFVALGTGYAGLPEAGEYTIRIDAGGTNSGGAQLKVSADEVTPLTLNQTPLLPLYSVQATEGSSSWHSFFANKGQRLTVTLTEASHGLDYNSVRLHLLSPTGQKIRSSPNASAENFVTLNTGFSGVPSTGLYTIEVDAVDNRVGFAKLRATLDQESPVTLNGPQIATLQDGLGSSSWHQFTAVADQRVSVAVSDIAYARIYRDSVVSVFDPAGKKISSGLNSSSEEYVAFSVRTESAGTYTVEIDAQRINSGPSNLAVFTDSAGTVRAPLGSPVVGSTLLAERPEGSVIRWQSCPATGTSGCSNLGSATGQRLGPETWNRRIQYTATTNGQTTTSPLTGVIGGACSVGVPGGALTINGSLRSDPNVTWETKRFTNLVSPGRGCLRLNLFIKDDWVGVAGVAELSGNNRSFDPTAGVERSKASVFLDFSRGTVTASAAKTESKVVSVVSSHAPRETHVVSSEASFDDRRNAGQNVVYVRIIGPEEFELRYHGLVSTPAGVYFCPPPVGINLWGCGKELAPAIDGAIRFRLDARGNFVDECVDRNKYPSLEVYHDRPNSITRYNVAQVLTSDEGISFLSLLDVPFRKYSC
jgi:hypothetical protein